MDKGEFYKRQISLGEIGKDGQKKLSESQVLVIGAGGLGSPLLNYIARAGVGSITIYDHDIIDSTNIHRQILFTVDDIAKNKALTAQETLSKINPFITIIGVAKRFDTTTDIRCFDIIIDCSDNLRTKFIAHDMSFKFKKKFIMASIHKFEGQVQVFDFSTQNQTSPCLRCLWGKVPSSAVQTCEDVGILGASVGVVGVIQALEVLKTILYLDRLKNEQSLHIDLLTLSTYKFKIQKDPKCPLCSGLVKTIDDKDSELEISRQEALTEDFITVCLFENTKVEYDILSSIENVIKDTEHINKNQKMVIVCNKGVSSLSAVKLLREHNYTKVFSLKDGLSSVL